MIEPDADQEDDVHVYPTYGREHEMTIKRWCSPSRNEEEPLIVVHREDN